jgi:hypothetical protein
MDLLSLSEGMRTLERLLKNLNSKPKAAKLLSLCPILLVIVMALLYSTSVTNMIVCYHTYIGKTKGVLCDLVHLQLLHNEHSRNP